MINRANNERKIHINKRETNITINSLRDHLLRRRLPLQSTQPNKTQKCPISQCTHQNQTSKFRNIPFQLHSTNTNLQLVRRVADYYLKI